MRGEEAKPSPFPSPLKKERRPLSRIKCSGDVVRIESLRVSAFTIPTETHEADGTYEWNSTTIVVVEVAAGGNMGSGTPTPIQRQRN